MRRRGPLTADVKLLMTFSFATAQIIAVLFTAGGAVHIAAEDSPAPHGFHLENSDAGASTMAEKLVPLRDMKREPLFCIGIAPGAKLEGVLAEQLMSTPVRRFILAQPMFHSFANAEQLDPNQGQTLLLACRKQFSRK